MKRVQKPVALGIAAGSAVLLTLVAVAGWEGIEREYRLWRLRRDPDLLERMLMVSSAGSRAAIRRFVEEPPGREALFRLLLQEVEGNRPGLTRAASEGAHVLTARKRVTINRDHNSVFLDHRGVHASAYMECSPVLAAVTGFLHVYPGDPLSLPDLKEVEFQVREIKEGEVSWPEWCRWARAVHQSHARLRAGEDSGTPAWAVYFRRRLEGFDGFPMQDIKVNPASRLGKERVNR